MKIDEARFLAQLLPRLPVAAEVVIPPGDDCAAIPFGRDELLLIAVDQVAADTHYYGRDAAAPTPPEQAGRKLLARNLSDIAAMGGIPKYAVLAVAAPADCPESWLTAFADGVIQLAESEGVSLIGGDLGKGDTDVAALTILGTVPKGEVCRRTAGIAEQRLLVTGELGASLETGRHLTFMPRWREGRWLAEQGFTRCMIDLSDGLLADLTRLCDASKLAAELNSAAIPHAVSATHCPVTLEQALTDGEDYELLFTVDADQVELLRQTWPFSVPLTDVGRLKSPGTNRDVGRIYDLAGAEFDPQLFGYQHFSA